jgi:hypothetical protein
MTLLASGVFVGAVAIPWVVLSPMIALGGALLAAAFATLFGQQSPLRGYRRYADDWEFANSSDPILPVHWEATRLRESGDEADAIAAIRTSFSGQPRGLALAVDAYRRLGGEMAADQLDEIAKRGSPAGIRVQAVRAISAVSSPDSVQLLAELLDSDDRAIRIAALKGLCGASTPEASRELERRRANFGIFERRALKKSVSATS